MFLPSPIKIDRLASSLRRPLQDRRCRSHNFRIKGRSIIILFPLLPMLPYCVWKLVYENGMCCTLPPVHNVQDLDLWGRKRRSMGQSIQKYRQISIVCYLCVICHKLSCVLVKRYYNVKSENGYQMFHWVFPIFSLGHPATNTALCSVASSGKRPEWFRLVTRSDMWRHKWPGSEKGYCYTNTNIMIYLHHGQKGENTV